MMDGGWGTVTRKACKRAECGKLFTGPQSTLYCCMACAEQVKRQKHREAHERQKQRMLKRKARA